LGTRIPVRIILSHIAAGDDYSTILKQFPRIQQEDIMACLKYAAYLATEKSVLITDVHPEYIYITVPY